jgi:hypothetical protein
MHIEVELRNEALRSGDYEERAKGNQGTECAIVDALVCLKCQVN